nr:hypothetical protein Hi04_10k_c1074_00026 [uncultured bacterium]
MTRTKWMRLVVRDSADVLRWASQEDARQLDEFRYRVIGGREFVSFRLVPRYRIDIGTHEIIVVACARGSAAHRLVLTLRKSARRLGRSMAAAVNWLVAPRAPDAVPVAIRSGEVHHLPLRAGLPSRF